MFQYNKIIKLYKKIIIIKYIHYQLSLFYPLGFIFLTGFLLKLKNSLINFIIF